MTYCTIDQNHALDSVRDMTLLEECRPALKDKTPVRIETTIQNIDRAFGTILSNEVSRAHGADGLPADTIHIKAKGSAGQSVAAWLVHGVTIEVEGDANDYAGKGLSGGRLIVYPPRTADFVPEKNIIIGNVALYGATSGEVLRPQPLENGARMATPPERCIDIGSPGACCIRSLARHQKRVDCFFQQNGRMGPWSVQGRPLKGKFLECIGQARLQCFGIPGFVSTTVPQLEVAAHAEQQRFARDAGGRAQFR